MTFHTVCEREKRALFTFHRAEPRENKGGRWRRRVPFQLFCTRVLSLLEKKETNEFDDKSAGDDRPSYKKILIGREKR